MFSIPAGGKKVLHYLLRQYGSQPHVHSDVPLPHMRRRAYRAI
jgi:hypothetical protein